jgi:hypothetical protein
MKNLILPVILSMCFNAFTPTHTQPARNSLSHDSIHMSAEILVEKDPDLDQATAIALAEKLANGEELDCVSREYDDMDPAIELFDREDGEYYAEYHYPDGSKKTVIITAVSTDTGTVSGGTYQSGSNWYTWTGAYVSVTTSLYSASMRATFSGSAYDAAIQSVWNGSASAYLGTATVSAPYIQRQYATSTNPALAYMSFSINGLTSFSGTLALKVPMAIFQPEVYVFKQGAGV